MLVNKIDKASVESDDIDLQPELAAHFQVMNIPTLAVMKDGMIAKQVIGCRPNEQIKTMM